MRVLVTGSSGFIARFLQQYPHGRQRSHLARAQAAQQLRGSLTKRTDLSGYSQAHLDRIALRLNRRPRETLGFQTPADKLSAYVASIH